MVMMAPVSALRSATCSVHVTRAIRTESRLASSSSSSMTPRQPLAPLPMPPNQPREDYVAPTLYTLSYISRALRIVIYTAMGLTAAGLVGYEGFHLYIENVLLKGPQPGWEEVHQSWTGPNGGTSSRLGWRARHALRGAYLLQEHGSGNARGTIGDGGVNRIDRGYDEAREYIRVAIEEARKEGLVFPGAGATADREAVDLIMLQAGIMERIATSASLREAKRLYGEAFNHGSMTTDRRMRLCGKIGDIAQRVGEDGKAWWLRGLGLIDIAVPRIDTAAPTQQPTKRGWFGSKPATVDSTHATLAGMDISDQSRRMALTLLVSLEASLATSASLPAATAIQDFALSLIPISTGADLNAAWLEHRRALLTLHQASVAYASLDVARALLLAQSAQTGADSVLAALPDVESAPGKQLRLDALSLCAEAAYTRGVLLERSNEIGKLGQAKDLFERARSLTAGDQAETEARAGAAGAGAEDGKYWRAWARVQGKIEAASST